MTDDIAATIKREAGNPAWITYTLVAVVIFALVFEVAQLLQAPGVIVEHLQGLILTGLVVVGALSVLQLGKMAARSVEVAR